MTQLRTRVDPLTGEVNQDPQIQDFAALLMSLDKGKPHQDMSEAFWDLVQKVDELHKKGTVTLTLSVEPTSKGDGGPLAVAAEVKLSLPKPPSSATIMWPDHDGNLARNDPNQPEIEGIRVIEDTDKNVRSI